VTPTPAAVVTRSVVRCGSDRLVAPFSWPSGLVVTNPVAARKPLMKSFDGATSRFEYEKG
jgi:hypothetical protein